MPDRREIARLPAWAETALTPEQQLMVRRRFGLLDGGDSDTEVPIRPVDPDGGNGGGTPAPTSPSPPAFLTHPYDVAQG